MTTLTAIKRPLVEDADLINQFADDPAVGYAELLERYTPVLLRMIRRHMRDQDEVMEVYTAICERLRASDYQALRRFREDSGLLPWLSVVAANACRDRFRKNRSISVPNSVLSQLDNKEQLVFKYYFYERLPHEDIAEIIASKHALTWSAMEVVWAIRKINDLLSVKKRWQLLSAVNSNRPTQSLDVLAEIGFEPSADEDETFEDALAHREQLQQLDEALKAMDGEDQLMIALWYDQGLSAIEIAEMMHLESHKYVYTRLRTLMNRLRKVLSEEP